MSCLLHNNMYRTGLKGDQPSKMGGGKLCSSWNCCYTSNHHNRANHRRFLYDNFPNFKNCFSSLSSASTLPLFFPSFYQYQISNIMTHNNNIMFKSWISNESSSKVEVQNNFFENCIGQPLWSTHSHILKKGEVTQSMTGNEYMNRRARFIESLPTNSVALVPASPIKWMSPNSIPYVFKQNPDFLYLTGFQESDSLLCIEKHDNGDSRTSLFVKSRDHKREIWEGPCCGVARAPKLFGVDEAYPLNCIQDKLESILNKIDCIYYDCSVNPDLNAKLTAAGLFLGKTVLPYHSRIHKMRVQKSNSEINLLTEASRITASSIKHAMNRTRSCVGKFELSLANEFEYEAKRIAYSKNMLCQLAYPTVIASGAMTNILHSTFGDQILMEGNLVLMDAGIECNGYCGDITRTWPISGKFTSAQRLLYEIVLSTQLKCIKLLDLSQNHTLFDIHKKSCEYITEGLLRLGLLHGSPEENISSRKYTAFYPHSIGHWLGLDVHDTASVQLDEPLKVGMILTIEPGLYCPNSPLIPLPFRGVGVRIEDNILITEDKPVLLSSGCPKLPEEIENIVLSGKPR